MKNNKHVVLYVDDDQDMLDSTRIILESSGYIMEEASSAESGTRKFQECNPDFIIVDLMMEEIDSGVNCVKEIKLLGNKAPVFMLSSVGDNFSTITNTSELGLAGVLQKPLEPEKLITALNSRL
jgi:DNA-binding response OmpR family regulator